MQKLTQQPSKNTTFHIRVESLEGTRSHQSTKFEVRYSSSSSGFLQNRGNNHRPFVDWRTQIPAAVIERSTQAGMETLLNQPTHRITITQETPRNLWFEARFQKFGVNHEKLRKRVFTRFADAPTVWGDIDCTSAFRTHRVIRRKTPRVVLRNLNKTRWFEDFRAVPATLRVRRCCRRLGMRGRLPRL